MNDRFINDDREWLEADGLGGFASGTVERRAHAPLSRAAADGDDAADRPHGAGQRLRRLGRTPDGVDSRSRSQRYRPDVVYPDGAGASWRSRTSRGRRGPFASRRSVAVSRRSSCRTAAGRRRALALVEAAAGARDSSACGRSSRAATITRCTTRTAASALTRRVDGDTASLAALRRRAGHRQPRQRRYQHDPLVSQLPLRGGAGARPRRHRGSAVAGHADLRSRRRRGRVDARRRRARRPRRISVRDAPTRCATPSARAARRSPPRSSAPPTPTSCARRGRDDHRRLSVVHRLGPRHVHRAARPVPRHRPARRRARHPARVGRRGLARACCRTASPTRGEAPEFNAVDASLWFVVAVARAARRRRRRQGRPARRRSGRAARRRRRDPRGLRARHALRHPRSTPTACSRRRAGRAAHLDGREGRRLGGDAAHRQAGRGAGAVAERAGVCAALGRALAGGVSTRGRASFAARFWNADGRCLYDVVDVDHVPGRVDAPFRPNQILAVGGLPTRCSTATAPASSSTPSSASCWTPLGLRSLAPGEPGYAARYEGGPRERDGAYHQGTVWPWLLGPFVDAWLRVRGGHRRGARGARALPRAAARASRRGRPRPRLRDRRRRRAVHAARLSVPGLVGRGRGG